MNFYFKHSILVSFLWFTWFASAQCNQPRLDHEICDISILDNNNDTIPDGLLDLNEVYTLRTGSAIPPGATWSTTSELRLVLNEVTGVVSVWELQEATTIVNENDYLFTLSQGTNCIVEIRLLLAPYPGVAQEPSGSNNVNFEVCDNHAILNTEGVFQEGFDLFSTLTSDNQVPPPHLNGQWFRLDISGTEIPLNNSIQRVSVPYSGGINSIDNLLINYRYKVTSSITGCVTTRSVDVSVSIVRQVFAGNTKNPGICEFDILNEINDPTIPESDLVYNELDLTDDDYLEGEDLNGNWQPDVNPQNSDAEDSVIDFHKIYMDEVIIPNNKRFGHIDVPARYVVLKRSGVCENDTTNLLITVFEGLRDFTQNTNTNRFCEEGSITSVRLFDLIEFTNEDGTDFIYENSSEFTSWEYKEGPRDIDGIRQPIVDLEDTGGVFNFLTPDPDDPPSNFIPPGTYIFEYIVDPWINAPTVYNECIESIRRGEMCSMTCDEKRGEIQVVILPLEYAGENTVATLCSNAGVVNLTDMLVSESPTRAVSRTGVWIDNNGQVVDENYEVPNIPIVNGDRQYVFTYSTNTIEGCTDTSTLTLDVTKAPYAGANVPVDICTDNLSVVLYDLVNNDPVNIADPTGSWVGPNGYQSVDHTGTFEDGNIALPVLQPGIYTYTVQGKGACTGEVVTSQVTISFVEPLRVTGRFDQEVCKLTGKTTFDLFNFLDISASLDGTFTAVDDKGGDLPSLQTLIDTNGVLDYTSLSGGTYHFRYDVTATPPCVGKSQSMTLKIFDESSFPRPGIGTTLTVCSNGRDLVLFDQLTSSAGETIQDDGIWTGPFDYVSSDNQGIFIEGDQNLPVLQEGVYTYTVKGQGPCDVVELTSQIRVSFSVPFFLGNDFQEDFCIKDVKVDLFELLDRVTVRTGVFVSTQSDVDLSDEGVFTFREAGLFEFLYIVNNAAPCTDSQLKVTINVKEVEIPENPMDTYCILDAVHLSDVEIPLDQKWYLTELDENPYTENPLLKNGMTFYLEKEEFGCTSDRLPVEFKILNVGQKDEVGVVKHCTIDFQEAVTPNNDGTNDTFRVNTAEDSVLSDRIIERMDENSIWKGKYFNLQLPFPNYELQIFNRYGALVFEGNSRAAEFRGEGNQVGQKNGDLPTGVYFYIFNPNYENHQPIQGSFYLSK